MVRRTYGSVRSQLARVCAATGVAASDSRVMEYTNLAIEELMTVQLWPTVVDRIRFTLSHKKFVLPSDYDRCLYLTVDCVPIQMMSPWMEFVGYGLELLNSLPSAGTGLNEQRWAGVLDKDEAATFEERPRDGNTYFPRVFGQTDERVDGVRPSIIIQGYDANGDWIRTSDGAGGFIDGVSIEINGDTAPFYIQSTQSFSYVTATIKPVTKRNVMLWAFTQDASVSWYIGQYANVDTTPRYRQYSIPGLWFQADQTPIKTVVARCLRKYVPIREDNDWLLISNLPALLSMVQAIYYRTANDFQNYVLYRQGAVQILREEAKAYIGMSNQKPPITLSEGAGERYDGLYVL